MEAVNSGRNFGVSMIRVMEQIEREPAGDLTGSPQTQGPDPQTKSLTGTIRAL